MGIAQRQIHVKLSQNPQKRSNANLPQKRNNSLGKWIRTQRIAKNLAPYHLAAKIGIPTALVRSWEGDLVHPDKLQWRNLATVLEFPNHLL
ncbi:MAG TPA: hypothetical protein VGI03_14190 [Verrucomicrobiae bacterium]|jgi:ribosome-binding protein aMBF1 (putative translation factor)